MTEFNVTVDLTISVTVDAKSEDDLPAKVTDGIMSALAKHTDFSRVRIHPKSGIRKGSAVAGHGPAAGTGAATNEAPSASVGTDRNGYGQKHAGEKNGTPLALVPTDLTAKPAAGGEFQVLTKSGAVICNAPSDHPDWLRAIAQAVNAGMRLNA